jgi:large subunit ribosomal protein L4
MQVEVKDILGKAVGKVDLPEAIFDRPMNEHVLYLVTKAYRANRRQGTHATKTKSMVSGGGKKPFKQKGTGSARQGSSRASNMPGGGIAHGPQPRSYRQDINAKTKQLALAVALSDKLRHNKLHVLRDLDLNKYSSKHVVGILKNFGTASGLFADHREDDYLWRSARNVYKSSGFEANAINCEHVLLHDDVFITEKALAELQKRLGGE